MKQQSLDHEHWLDLSEAAEYLGVHFTTLRRWADAGFLPVLRTPGKRRRFSKSALDTFLEQMKQDGPAAGLLAIQPLQERAIDNARESVRGLPASNTWLERIDQEQRARMRGTGHRLTALLLQYNSRTDGGDAFLEEGKRIMREYSQVCANHGLSLQDTVRIFLFFRRSILDAVHETGHLANSDDSAGLRLYHRTTDFLDLLVLELIDSYQQSKSLIQE